MYRCFTSLLLVMVSALTLNGCGTYYGKLTIGDDSPRVTNAKHQCFVKRYAPEIGFVETECFETFYINNQQCWRKWTTVTGRSQYGQYGQPYIMPGVCGITVPDWFKPPVKFW